MRNYFKIFDQYQVSLRSTNNEHFCSGAVLGNRYVVTSANCNLNVTYIIHAGSHKNDDLAINRPVQNAKTHPYFKKEIPSWYGKKKYFEKLKKDTQLH